MKFRKVASILLLIFVMLGAGALIPAQSALAAPAEVVTSAPQAATLYIVRRGDTLSQIARWYGSTVQAIMNYNGLHSTMIYVGQRLYIPTGTPPSPPPPAGGSWYQVRAGDTLYRIAVRYGTTVQALMQANGLGSTMIYVGQWLRISGYAPPPHHDGGYYQVRYGDTLSQIALRYGTTVWAIMNHNGLSSTYIYAGQWLRIP